MLSGHLQKPKKKKKKFMTLDPRSNHLIYLIICLSSEYLYHICNRQKRDVIDCLFLIVFLLCDAISLFCFIGFEK